MKEIIVNGYTILSDAEIEPKVNANFELVQVIEVADTRSTDQTTIQYEDRDVIEIQFEDGTVWLTPATQVQNVFERSNRAGQSSVYTIPNSISINTQDRGLKEILVKTVKYFKSKFSPGLSNTVKKNLGEGIDSILMKKEGLFSVSPIKSEDYKINESIFHLSEPKYHNKNKNKPYLLFLHGFISKFEGAFEDIIMPSTSNADQVKPSILATAIISEYEDRILAFDHKTITKSPIQNVIELLEQLDDGIQLDILAHSRGGLIADLLTICNIDNDSMFTKEDFDVLEGKDQKLLKDLSELAKKKKIRVRKVIRAGSPMNGTYLLTNQIDHFLSALIALINIAHKKTSWIKDIYDDLKEFTMSVIGTNAEVDHFPGMKAMVPNSNLLRMLNDKSRELDIPLFTIEGNSEVGKNILTSFFVILSNLIYRQANDFIVNTSSMRFGTLRTDGAFVFKSEDNLTTHFKYFSHPNTRNALFEALMWDPDTQKDYLPNYFESVTREELLTQFAERFSGSRGGDTDTNIEEIIVGEDPKPVDLLDLLYENETNEDLMQSDAIEISLKHGNLIFAEYPVMCGHFKSDTIISAERVIDKQLDYALTDHFFFGNYPAEPKDNIVIYDEENSFKGCLLIGFGDTIEFTEFKLRKAVEFGIIAYALHIRDNMKSISQQAKKSISSLCIGSGFAGLSMDTALTSLLFGINNANKKIDEFNLQLIEKNKGTNLDVNQYLTPITKLELIELFEHKAREAFYSLERIKKLNYKLKIEVPKKIDSFYGAQKQLQSTLSQSWWYDFITKKETNPDDKNAKLSFLSSKGTAKIDETADFYSVELVTKLLESYSKTRNYDQDLSNSLFQLLIPKKIRAFLRGQHNIIWKMDKEIARIPWEMIHDSASDKYPMFVNCGIIRQLISSRTFPSDKITREPKALIIGDPIYTNFSQLPGAQAEAELLKNKLDEKPKWKVNPLIGKSLIENSLALLNTRYRLLHICGHGTYDPKTGKAGIVMEDTTLDTVFFNSLDNIPEMAFINCCYSGTTDQEFENLYAHRYDLAASIGTQLIEMGVTAVIITGWAVDDKAAYDFADKFYDQMLSGAYFGEATKNARRFIYEKYPNNKTWAAYQCYGNPWYQLSEWKSSGGFKISHNTTNEVKVELYNLKKQIINKESADYIFNKTKAILEYVKGKWPKKTKLYEKIAAIFIDLDHLDMAIEVMEEALNLPDAQYNVSIYEKYINAKITHSINVNTDLKINPNAHYEVKEFHDLVSDLKTKLDCLIKIGESSERYSHYGKFAKRLTMCNYNNKREDHLNDVVTYYEKAYELLKEGGLLNLNYPLVMFLQANYFTDQKIRKVEFRGESMWISNLLDLLEEKIDKIPSQKNNFWNDIALINILTTKLIYSTESNEISDYQDKIVKNYSLKFAKSGTYKNIRAEIDQFEFLSVLIQSKQESDPESKTKYAKALGYKLAAVNKLLKELYILKNRK